MENQTKFVKSYIAKFYEDENGLIHKETDNSGFSAVEVLGLLEFTKQKVFDVMNGGVTVHKEEESNNRLTIKEAIEKEYMNVRLKNALIEYAKLYSVEYLDEVDENKMAKKLRNVGNFTKFELRDLKEKLNIK